MWTGEREEAVSCLKKYLALPESVWADERIEAMKYLGDLLPNEKLKWLRLSAAEAPNRRETWLNLAEHYYAISDWANLHAVAQEGIKITQRSHNYLEYTHAWGGKIWDLAGLGAWNLGLKDVSLKMFEQACALEPADGRIAGNLQFVKNSIEGNN
jgi:tetratricopeptide (TPR) repeat protein